MKLYYIKSDSRAEGANDWTEKVVCASSPADAMDAIGEPEATRCRLEVEEIGDADPSVGRGIVCWGLHDHEDDIENWATREQIAEWATEAEKAAEIAGPLEDLREAATNAAGAWDRYVKDPSEANFAEVGLWITSVRHSLGSTTLPSEEHQDFVVAMLACAEGHYGGSRLRSLIELAFGHGLISRERARRALEDFGVDSGCVSKWAVGGN